MSAEWMRTLEGEADATKIEAALDLLRVNHAVVTMENTRLASMRDDLLANESDLIAGTRSLRGALEDLTKVGTILETITSVLNTVGKIITLL
ncbi:MAG: hypothetical protein ACC682_11650 [Gemmatimonadota bacterium]